MAVSNAKKMAYSQVLVIIQKLSQEEYGRIPTEKIAFLKANQLEGYDFKLNQQKPIEEQILDDTKIILANLFIKYVATKEDKKQLYEIARQKQNEKKPLPNTSEKLNQIQEEKMTVKEEILQMQVVTSKETWFQRFLFKMKQWIKRG